MRLDPLTLRYFVSVAEEGTIAAAAEREHIAAAAISKRISDLEASLGASLLMRSNRGVEPTPAGVTLLNLARGVLHDLDDIFFQMRDFSGGTRGYVRVVANISAITQFLPTALKAFVTRFPDIQIRLDEMTSADVVRVVAENGADVGIFSAWPHGQDIDVLPFRHDELVLAVPGNHPLAARQSISFRETLGFDYVGLRAGSSINLQLQHAAAELGATVKLRIHVTSFDALCLMAAAGLGIGVLPKGSVAPYLQALDLRAIPLEDPWARRELAMCVRNYASLSGATRLLVEHLGPMELGEKASG